MGIAPFLTIRDGRGQEVANVLPIVLETTAQLGWRISSVLPLGVVLLVCTALHAVRRPVFGASLLTGYLGALSPPMVA